jgi:hypothetical protein
MVLLSSLSVFCLFVIAIPHTIRHPPLSFEQHTQPVIFR